jgi:hypothetical protein
MKPLYWIFLEDEYEGMFDDKGKLLDYWHCNDASWRVEYFNGLMAKLGYEVVCIRDGHPLYKKLRTKLTKAVA